MSKCARHGCFKLSFDGNPSHFCSEACHNSANFARCAKPGCWNQAYQGQPGNFCTEACFLAMNPTPPPQQGGGVRCHRGGCPCQSWNGQPGEYCCRTCKYGTACITATTHAPRPGVPCARQGCAGQSWNGQPGEYCTQTCRRGDAGSRGQRRSSHGGGGGRAPLQRSPSGGGGGGGGCEFCVTGSPNGGFKLCGPCHTIMSAQHSNTKWLMDDDMTPDAKTWCIAYHGTSFSTAKIIVQTRVLKPSTGPKQLCGDGVYFASLERASHFANDAEKRGRGTGAAVVVCLVDCSNVVVGAGDDPAGNWKRSGASMYFTPTTSFSRRPELCVVDVSKIKVLGYRRPE